MIRIATVLVLSLLLAAPGYCQPVAAEEPAPATTTFEPTPSLDEIAIVQTPLVYAREIRVRNSGIAAALAGTGVIVLGAATSGAGVGVFFGSLHGDFGLMGGIMGVLFVGPALVVGGGYIALVGIFVSEAGLIAGSQNTRMMTGRKNPVLWVQLGAVVAAGGLTAGAAKTRSEPMAYGAVGAWTAVVLLPLVGTALNEARIGQARGQLALTPVLAPDHQGLALAGRF